MESRNKASHSLITGWLSVGGTVRATATSTSVKSGTTSDGHNSWPDVLSAGIRSSPERAPAIAREHTKTGCDRPAHHELDFVIRVIRAAK